jgi:hypothetical protein
MTTYHVADPKGAPCEAWLKHLYKTCTFTRSAHVWPVKDLCGSKSTMNGHLEVAAHGAPAGICTQVRTCGL